MPESAQPGSDGQKKNDSKGKEASSKDVNEDFEWLQYQDTGENRTRLAELLLRNPFVPLGAAATVIALAGGLYQMRQNNSMKQQFYMRARVGAQSFTIASLLGGLMYETHKREAANTALVEEKNTKTETTEKDSKSKN